MTARTQFWSDGGGTQSAAIAALIVQGKLPKPDLVAIADTERERTSVWEYHNQIIKPAMAAIGIEVHRIPKSAFAKEDLWVQWTESPRPQLLIPSFIANDDGTTGRISALCSSRWKRRVIQRWLREQGIEQCDCWMGFSLDEMRRVRVSDEKWYQYSYPLIFNVPMRRGECVRLVEAIGWPPPPRSACWMCPNREDPDWLDMKLNWPEDFARAVALERTLWETRPDFFLHRSLKPLDTIDFTAPPQFTMFAGAGDNDCTEGCFT